ncbi:MAG TPA: TetR/AcrR family transcriptional regulator [Ktedonobacteraceae bacterium]|nr:TetR/AcrR family transcriptional regulator [Ktedonobacteraceae bacterium]
MTQNSGDLRTRRTRKLLRDALLELIEERGFDAITVGEIAERAMVSRAAFYRYYQDKYDLVEQIFEEAMQALVNDVGHRSHDALSDIDPSNAPTPQRWVRLFEHFTEYERMYRVLLSGKGSPWFAQKMRASLAEIRREHEQVPASQATGKRAASSHPNVDGLVPALVDALLIDTVTWWLEQSRPYSPEQIATYCWRLIIALLKEANTWE